MSSKITELVLEDTNLQTEQIVKLLERIKMTKVCKHPNIFNIKHNNSVNIKKSLIMEVHRKIKCFQIDMYLDNFENSNSEDDLYN